MWLKRTVLPSAVAGVLGLGAGYWLQASPAPAQSPVAKEGGAAGAAAAAVREGRSGPGPESAAAALQSERHALRTGSADESPVAASAGGTAAAAANAETHAKLEQLQASQARAKRQLEEYERDIEKLEQSAGLRRTRHEYDLTNEDWAKFQREGTLKFRLPCGGEREAVPSDEVLQQLGLAPTDRETIARAYANSRKRRWDTLGPLCAKALGTTQDVAERVGLGPCQSIVMEYGMRFDGPLKTFRRVAGYRAGLGELSPPDQRSILEQLFLMLTGEISAFEADLATTLGPDEAKEIVFNKGLCFGDSTYQLGGRPDGRRDSPRGLQE